MFIGFVVALLVSVSDLNLVQSILIGTTIIIKACVLDIIMILQYVLLFLWRSLSKIGKDFLGYVGVCF